MTFFNDLGFCEHPNLIELKVGLFETKSLLEERYHRRSKVSSAVGYFDYFDNIIVGSLPIQGIRHFFGKCSGAI